MNDSPILVVHSSPPVRRKLSAALRELGAPTVEATSSTDALHFLARNGLPSSYVIAGDLERQGVGTAMIAALTAIDRVRATPMVLIIDDGQVAAAVPENVVQIAKFSKVDVLLSAIVTAYDRAAPIAAPPGTEANVAPSPEEAKTFEEMDKALEFFSNVVAMVASNKLPGPMMPETLAQVRKLKSDPDIDFRTIASVVEKQPTLSARIMRMANSAFYSRAVSATNVAQALSRLGVRKALELLQAIAMKDFVVGDHQGLRGLLEGNLRQAFLVALIGQRLAIQSGNDADEVYTLGLFHNIGPTFLAYTMALLAAKGKIEVPSIEAVKTIAARKCSELGAVIAEAMHLPPLVCEVFSEEQPSAAVRLIQQAVWMSGAVLGGVSIEAGEDADLLGISKEQCELVNSEADELRGKLDTFTTVS